MKENSRRSFIKKSGLLALTSTFGTSIVFGKFMPEGYEPIGDPDDFYRLFDKHEDMVVLNDKPWNVESPAHILDDRITPADKMFVRNNGLVPSDIDVENWVLRIDGESVRQPKEYTLKDLKTKFKPYSYQLTIECAGNGRSEFNPPAKGNQWTIGAISCAKWTGLRLRDLLEDVGIKEDAVYIGYYGTDLHLSGDMSKNPISRGIPISKAMMDETLIAYQMNDEEIPLVHGYPLRMVVGGWPASTSGKWLSRLSIRNKVHDGEKMMGTSYRVPCEPVAPGEKVKDEDMCIIESMPVKSLITYPKSGAVVDLGQSFEVRGHAWAGELTVARMKYSIDFGSTWKTCTLEPPKNRLAWQHWKAEVKLPAKGYYEVWARATDANGNAQPMVLPGWNPKGYLNNACHRIAVKVV